MNKDLEKLIEEIKELQGNLRGTNEEIIKLADQLPLLECPASNPHLGCNKVRITCTGSVRFEQGNNIVIWEANEIPELMDFLNRWYREDELLVSFFTIEKLKGRIRDFFTNVFGEGFEYVGELSGGLKLMAERLISYLESFNEEENEWYRSFLYLKCRFQDKEMNYRQEISRLFRNHNLHQYVPRGLLQDVIDNTNSLMNKRIIKLVSYAIAKERSKEENRIQGNGTNPED